MFVKTFDSKTITLAVEHTTTVGTVKTKIQDVEGIPADEQNLTFTGQHLDDGRTLLAYNIQDQNSLLLERRWQEEEQEARAIQLMVADLQRSTATIRKATEFIKWLAGSKNRVDIDTAYQMRDLSRDSSERPEDHVQEQGALHRRPWSTPQGHAVRREV